MSYRTREKMDMSERDRSEGISIDDTVEQTAWTAQYAYHSEVPQHESRACQEQNVIDDDAHVIATDILIYLPPGIGRTGVSMCPGGLPTEVWCIILDGIDDKATLSSLASTCKLLMALAKQTRAIVDRYGPWFAFTELVDMARISREMKQKPLLGEVLMSVKIPARFMTRFLCDCAGRLKALETNEFVGSGEVLPPYQRHILRAAGCFKLVTKLMLSDVSFWSFLDFARLVCALGSLSELELREVSWRRDDGRNLAAEPFAKALALRDLEIHDSSETLKYRKLFGAPQLFDSLTSLRLFGCVSVYCAVKHQEQDPENLSLDTKPHDAASAGTPFIHRRAVNMRVRPGLDSTTKWEAETRWTRECLDLLNCFLNPGASYLNAVDVVLHDCPKDILDIFREDPPPFYGLRDRGILSVKDCRDLDIWNETWGCEEVIIAPNVINQPTQ